MILYTTQAKFLSIVFQISYCSMFEQFIQYIQLQHQEQMQTFIFFFVIGYQIQKSSRNTRTIMISYFGVF